MNWVHNFFNFIYTNQISYTELRLKLHRFKRLRIYKTIKKVYYLITGIATTIIIAVSYEKNQRLSSVSCIILLVLFFIFPLIKALLNCLTSIRYFTVVSIALNILTSVFIFSDNIILALFLFLLVYTFLSILANTDVAITVNTIIEFILTLFTLARDIIIDLIDLFYNELVKQGLIDEANIYINTLNVNEFKICLDMVLLPLLLINGIALLFAVIHSYWIKKYNDGLEIQLINFDDEDINNEDNAFDECSIDDSDDTK